MGAYATWDLLACAPATFAVGIPMSGGGDTKLAARVTARVWAFHGIPDRSVPVNASREIVDAVAATRSPLLNVSWATEGRRTTRGCPQLSSYPAAPRGPRRCLSGGRTTDVAVGLRYTEFPHAPHDAVNYPLFDKGVAEPLFKWTLRQLQAAGFGAKKQDSAAAKKSDCPPRAAMKPVDNKSAAKKTPPAAAAAKQPAVKGHKASMLS